MYKVFRRSISHKLFIFIFISLKNLFNWTKHSLEGISLDVNNFSWSLAFNTSLSRSISDQRNFTKIVSFLEFVDCLFLFLGNEVSFGDQVEFVALFSFSNDVVSNIIILLFQDIAKLIPFVWINFRQN